MPRPLPRFEPDVQADDAAKIDEIVAETTETVVVSTVGAAGGDWRALRGIPAIGRGCSGAIPGTSPLGALFAKERRRVPRALREQRRRQGL